MYCQLSFEHQNFPDFNWKGYNLLQEAIQVQDKSMVIQLIKSGVEVKAPSPVHRCLSPLHLAVISRCQEIVEILLDAGAEIETVDWNSDTPLTLAAKTENKDLISVLLSNEVQNHENLEDLSHLHVACMMNNIKVMRNLILSNAGRHINKSVKSTSMSWPGYTALHFAVHYGCIDAVEYLLKCGADITAEDSRELTPLHLADLQRNEKIIDLLLVAHKFKYKNPVSPQGMTHLHIACTRNDPSILEHFLKLGEDLNRRVTYVKSTPWCHFRPIDFAIYYGCNRVVNFLLAAHVELQTQLCHVLMSHAFVEKNDTIYNSVLKQKSASNENFKVVEKMPDLHLACVLDITVVDINELISTDDFFDLDKPIYMGSTLLHFAAKSNSIEATKLLIDHGANIMVIDFHGETPIHIAFKNRYTEIFHLLLKNLISPIENVINHEALSIFHILCTTDDLKAIKKLAQTAGVDINAKVKSESTYWPGFTAMHFACQFGQIKTVELLLELNADISITDEMKSTSLDIVIHTYLFYGNQKKCEAYEFLMKIISSRDSSNPIFLKLSPLHMMCAINTFQLQEMEQYLLSHKDELNKFTDLPKLDRYDKCTPLHIAIFYHNFGQAKLLLENGADAFAVNGEGKTPLEYMIIPDRLFFSPEVPKILSEAKVCFIVGTPIPSLKPSHFHIACALCYVDVVRRVLNGISDKMLKEALVNARDRYGRTPLHSVAQRFKEEPVQQLQTEIVRLLLESGANPNAQDYQLETPLHCAYQSTNAQVCKLLINYGADVNAQTIYGKTCLHLLFVFVDESVDERTALLLDNGANINLVDRSGGTCISGDLGLGEEEEYEDDTRKFVVNMMQHIRKLLLIGRYVHEGNLQAYSTYLVEHDVNEYFEEAAFTQKCKEELELMGTLNIDEDTTLRDILMKHPNEMAFRCENVYLRRLANSKDFLLRYPIYGSLVRLQMKYGKVRRLLLTKSKKSFVSVSGTYLSEPCLEAVFKYLSNSDLENIIVSEGMV